MKSSKSFFRVTMSVATLSSLLSIPLASASESGSVATVQKSLSASLPSQKALLTPVASARGGTSSGGGEGYRADFVSVAHEVYEWLVTHPAFDSRVTPAEFLLAIEPNKITTSSTQLMYKGLPVDALYNDANQVITLYPAGWDKDGQPERWKLVAHELFRKMHLEGDGYELSSKLVSQKFAKPDISMLKSGDYSAIEDNTLSSSTDGGCYRHLEVNPIDAIAVVQFREKQPGDCDFYKYHGMGGSASNFTCFSGDTLQQSSDLNYQVFSAFEDGLPTYCISRNVYSDTDPALPSSLFHLRVEMLEPLADGNFIVKTLRVVPYGTENRPNVDGCVPSLQSCDSLAADYRESKFMPISAR